MVRSVSGYCLGVVLALGIAGCVDPDKQADNYFRDQGLNRIRRPNDYMAPGSVLVVSKDKKVVVYADNFLDYIDNPPDTEYPLIAGSEVLPSADNQTGMKVDVALKFLDSLLPVKFTGNVNLTSDVKFDQATAKVSRMKILDLTRFLSREHSKPFKAQMLQLINKENSIYVGYQTYRANKLSLVSVGGGDIAAGMEIGKVVPILESGQPKVTWTKKSKSQIVIDGDAFYVFAVKTAKLNYDKNTKLWSWDITNFAPKGVLAAGTDDKYASSPVGANPTDFKLLEVTRRVLIPE